MQFNGDNVEDNEDCEKEDDEDENNRVNDSKSFLPGGNLFEEISNELRRHHVLKLNLVLLQSFNELLACSQ